jgi:signal transduction histidine kinase
MLGDCQTVKQKNTGFDAPLQDHNEQGDHSVVRVLMIEDDPAYRTFVRRLLLQDSNTHFEFIGLANLCECKKFLSEEHVDIILLDLSLPDSAGVSTLNKVLEMSVGTPIIVLTAREGDNLGLLAIGLGAQDYLVKHEISNDALIRCIRYALERKKFEESKLRLAAMQGFISTLAHDLQVPLVGSKNVLDALVDGAFGELQGDLLRVLQSLKDSNQEQLHVVQRLLELYKYELDSPNLLFERLDLSELINYSINHANCDGKQIELHLPAGLPAVFGDRSALIRLIDNLLDNAIKYSPEHTKITILLELDRDKVLINIHNFGAAIPEQLRKGMFEQFWQGVPGKTYVAHTGIGLYLCHRIATLHRARLACASDEKNGTTMTIRIPVFNPQK